MGDVAPEKNGVVDGGDAPPAKRPKLARKKIIIDTDPGVDDMMAILMAFQTPELDILGITSTFGNVHTALATSNALYLCELAGRSDVPVSEGDAGPLNGMGARIADFVHGRDGLGNTHPPKPKGKPIEKRAPQFLVDTVAAHPGEVTVLALGPLTNVARALELDAAFAEKVGEIVVLGGSFFALGNVNPAAEANVFNDPQAADIVFTCGAKSIRVVGINVTQQVQLSVEDLHRIRDSKGRYGHFVAACCEFYTAWHISSDGLEGIFVHDPSALAAALDASLFTWAEGVVRVAVDGICEGLTVLDVGHKRWASENEWTSRPTVRVALEVDKEGVRDLVMKRLMAP